MLDGVIKRELAACNGGPGLTVDELSRRLGANPATVRQAISDLVFEQRAVTCDRDGRYRLGDPTHLIEMSSDG